MKMFTKLIKSRVILSAIICSLFAFKANAQSAAIVGSTINCIGTPATLSVNVNGLQAPLSYLWSNGATTATVTINNNALLRVRVTGTNGAVNSPWRIFLFLPSPNAGITANGPLEICDGQSVGLTATGGNFLTGYLWSNGATTQSIPVTQAGTYTVTLTQAFSGCSSTASIDVLPATITASISASGSLELCPGEKVDLEAIGGNASSSYLWSTGETTQTITVETTGNYVVTITQGAGCSGTSAPIHVEAYDVNFEPKFVPNGPLTFCKPGSVTLTADPGFSGYLWSTGETTQAITVVLDGSGGPILDTLSVTLSVTINNNCSFSTAPIVIRSVREPQLRPEFCPNFNMAMSDSIKTGIVLPINGVTPDYEFEFVETTNSGSPFSVVVSGTRWLRLADVTPALQVGKFYNVRTRGIVNGVPYCYGNMCQIGVGSLRIGNGSLHEVVDAEDGERFMVRDGINFNIYPNPSNTNFTANIFTADENPINVNVFDLAGRSVATYQLASTETEFQFGNDLNAGVYFVEFTQGQSLKQVTRLVKTN